MPAEPAPRARLSLFPAVSSPASWASPPAEPEVYPVEMTLSLHFANAFDPIAAKYMKKGSIMRLFALLALLLTWNTAWAEDVVRLGNLKFAHYGAVSYMQENGSKFGLKVEETVFPKGIDIFPALVRGEVDIAASAADAAIANRAGGGRIYVVAGFAKGGARMVGRSDYDFKTVGDLKGRKVGVARGGAQELLLLAELAKGGLTWSDRPGSDVQIVLSAFR